MKKWIVIAAVIGGLYYYAAHTEGGKNHANQLARWIDQLTGQKITGIGDNDTKTTIYKIQNPDGTWSYSNEKPADNSKVIEQEYRSDTNVLPPLPKDKAND